MKIGSFLVYSALCLSSASAFMPEMSRPPAMMTQQFMFGGAGAGMPAEDDPEEMKKMEEAAKAMGMSLQEYQLGIKARLRLTEQLDEARVSGGSPEKVAVERCGNNPPKFLEITVTEEGKALGKEQVSKELVTALKTASDASRQVRTEAQKSMMQFIQEEMKKMGK